VTERETLRLHPPVIFWWVWVVFVVANVADYAAQGLPSARFGSLLAAVLLLVTGVVFTLAARPKVISGGDGLTVVNPFRVHRLPWPVIESVDAGEWVRVRYAQRAGGAAAGPGATQRVVHCWALYVSTRTRRKLAVGGSAGSPGVPRRLRGLVAAAPSGYAQPSSRLPEEALRLASLPASAAMAVRLNSRAEKERRRAEGRAGEASTATTDWSWPAVAAVAVPAVILLAVALA
jgi:hypothetical protein